ncbi:MAG: glycosyltransferase family 4 protein [Thermaerobacter sp.]|nr:glycosyltransferase family 4 protein [Thermaerobacter sp.]
MTLSFILPNLLTWDGDRPVLGGLERMAWALIRTARRAGYTVDVHQNGSSDWTRTIDGIPIRGHGLARLSLLAALESIHHHTTQSLYLSIMQEPMAYRPHSLVVSHGVWWDAPGMDADVQFQACRSALQQAEAIVSVDYNFLNVMRAVYPSLADKITVIPNCVDTRQFTPPSVPRPDPPLILFPRRIDPARGISLFLEAVAPLIAADRSLRVTMSVDRNNRPWNERFDRQLEAFPFSDRVQLVSTPFDEMPQLYRQADIVVIPSTYSEGTSLACLEAMASGSAVVATNIGGLTNLILSGFNGLLVPPRAGAVRDAIADLLARPAWRRELADNARRSAVCFGLEQWQASWTNALFSVYGRPASGGGQNG